MGYAVEALQTLQASRWTLLMARLFGKRAVGRDGCMTVVCYRWRGVSYMVSASCRAPHHKRR